MLTITPDIINVSTIRREDEYGYTEERTKWNVYNYFQNISKENEGLYFRKLEQREFFLIHAHDHSGHYKR